MTRVRPTGRVLHVTRARAPYLKALQESLAQSLGTNGSLTLVWPQDEASDFPDAAAVPVGDNVDIQRVRPAAGKLMKRSLPSPAMWRTLRSARPDLVWVHEFSPFTVTGLVYAKTSGIPVVVSTEVGCRNAHFFPWVVRLWHAHWGHFADGFIANCPAARDPLCGERTPIFNAFHAVDSRRFTPATARPPASLTTFAFVGHMIPRKGIDLLLNAAVELRRRGNGNFRLRLIGRDADQWALGEVKARGLEAFVEMPGFLSDGALQEAIRQTDVFVLPTRRDTYAAVVHEAACLGMPLLISQHAGACEALVEDGVNGYAIDPEDAHQFADRMQRMMDPATRIPMASAARRAGERHCAHARGQALREWLRTEYSV